jgi:hypothetical protein
MLVVCPVAFMLRPNFKCTQYLPATGLLSVIVVPPPQTLHFTAFAVVMKGSHVLLLLPEAHLRLKVDGMQFFWIKEAVLAVVQVAVPFALSLALQVPPVN